MSGNFTQFRIKGENALGFLGKRGAWQRRAELVCGYFWLWELLLPLTHHDAPLSQSRDGQSRLWTLKVKSVRGVGKACPEILTVY